MSRHFFSSFISLFSISVTFLTICLCFFIPIFSMDENVILSNPFENYSDVFSILDTSDFSWPTPGYTNITSRFGYRRSPTAGASTYHSGIDIGAPEGSNIISMFSGTVTYVGFSGAGGYTVTIKNGTFTASYCHVSPSFLVYVGQFVKKGTIIAKVGPKNVYGVLNNPYTDSNGNPTNRSHNRAPPTHHIKKG